VIAVVATGRKHDDPANLLHYRGLGCNFCRITAKFPGGSLEIPTLGGCKVRYFTGLPISSPIIDRIGVTSRGIADRTGATDEIDRIKRKKVAEKGS
jgi:hypothetical protein